MNKPSPLAWIFLKIIQIYQKTFSSWMGRSCRFHPTCSSYAREAIMRHGAVKGGFLAIRRILRCHPYNPGGYDPVPEKPEKDQFLGKNFCDHGDKCDTQNGIQKMEKQQKEESLCPHA